MFEDMPTRTVCFQYLDGLEVEIRPAVLELNQLYVAAAIAWLRPLMLASQLPDDNPHRLTEERSERALAKAYGMAIMVGSSTSDAMDRYTPAEWEAWLLGHRDEFASLRSVAAVPGNFVPDHPDGIATDDGLAAHLRTQAGY